MRNIVSYYNLNIKRAHMLANDLAVQLKPGIIVTLSGDLGVGKTTFAGKLINALTGKQEHITSPTFNLVHNYESPRGMIWHFDLYRLKAIEEIYQLGIEDAFHRGISIIEWPDLIEPLLQQNTLIKVVIEFAEKENLRNFTIDCHSRIP